MCIAVLHLFILLNILVLVLFLNKAIQSLQPCNLLERLRYNLLTEFDNRDKHLKYIIELNKNPLDHNKIILKLIF